MLKIRLRRMGSRHRPFYRVVVSDSHRVPRSSALEEIGYYDPRKSPAVLNLDVEAADKWVSQGAQPSETVKKLIARARSEAVNAAATPVVEKTEAVKEEAVVAEAAAEETAAEEATEAPVEAVAAEDKPAAAADA